MSTDLLALIRRLRTEGVQLRADDGQLKVSARKGALDPGTVQILRERKAEVLSWLHVLDEPSLQTLPKAPTDGGPVPATDGQLGMWLLAQQGLRDAYHIAAGLQLEGELDVAALQRAWESAVARHAGLRTRLVERDGGVWQQVDAQGVALSVADAGPAMDADAQARDLLQRFAAPAFDLASVGPVRVSLLRQNQHKHLLLLCLHHAAIDGWSLRQLLDEIAHDYARLLRGEPALTQSPSCDLADLAFWQQQRSAQGADAPALAHWNSRLAQLESPALLGELASFEGDRRAGQTLFELPAPLASALQGLAATSGITLYHWLLATFKLLLAKYAGSRDVALLVPVANRDMPGLQGLIGLLANTLPSVSRVDGALPLRELARSESQATLEAMAHQPVPFERVVRHCRAQGVEVPSQVMFSLQSVSEADLALPRLRATLLRHVPDTAKFDLTLTIEQRGEHLTGLLEYRCAVFEPWQMEAMANAYLHLLDQAVQTPDRPMAQFALAAPPQEPYAAVVAGLPNAIVQIAAQAARAPAAVALVQGERQMRYGELWQRVGLAARRLQQAGVRAGDHVGVLLPPGPAVVVGALAVLAVGAAYAPLDPHQPADRLAYMVKDAELVAVFAAPGSEPIGSAAWLPLTSAEDLHGDSHSFFVPYEAAPLAPAYLIFTSGSTGLPKAARVHQRGLTQLLQWYGQSCVDEYTRALIISNPSFDLTQKNLLAPLTRGARVVWPEAPRFEPAAIARALQAEQATLLNCTPTAFQALLASAQADGYAALASLRTVVLGGEPVSLEPLRRWQSVRPAEQAVRIINSYGPTECADVVAWETLPSDLETAVAPVSIGRAVPGCLLEVVDLDGQALPNGAIGELRIDGDCVGLGYFNREELTQRAFLPGGRGITGRRYGSGDFVRRLADGRLLYLGRRDQQVKFNGHRIELSEVESALLAHPDIIQAAVALRRDASGTDTLVAFCAMRDGMLLEESALRGALAAVLAQYQVPSRYIQLPELPLTRSGKIDRNALPQALPALARADEAEPPLPLTPFERRLAEIWQALLGCTRLPGPQDDFFALGGHSLLAIQLVARARQLLNVNWSV
ncbi:MAG TPA: amino acid adenylation domain-containing protein, partial [Chitinolyticbacter sp.]|nr:amino acid adenylation domain-containing protein [Chitinolyticbacter sp.]